MLKKICLMGLLPLFAACTTAELPAPASAELLCADLQQLVAAHGDGFASYRKTQLHNRRMDVWSTDYHLVGNACEIWRWSSGRSNYVCHHDFADRASAESTIANAAERAGQCLSGWQRSEQARPEGEGVRIVFQRGDALPALILQWVEVKGVVRSRWSGYVRVGDLADTP